MTNLNDATDAPSAREGAERLVAHWDDIEHRVRRLVDERPLACVLAAVAAGYLAARISSRL